MQPDAERLETMLTGKRKPEVPYSLKLREKLSSDLKLICAFVALVVCCPAVANADHLPPRYCPNGPGSKSCHQLDPLGGWGLNVKRTYNLAYDGDKVCKPIVNALNNALKSDHKKELASVTFPIPTHPELHLDPQQIGPVGAHGMYQAQNPLFSDPMFLRWQPLGGIAPPGGFTFEAKDWLDRWLIVDLENNGHRYLVHTGGTVMNVPEDQLDKHDWALPDEWKPYRELEEPWPNGPSQEAVTNPIERWQNLTWIWPGHASHPTGNEWRFPKIDVSSHPNFLKRWKLYQRTFAAPQFAKLDDRTYAVFMDSLYDLMVVDDLSRPLGDDLCYIQSDINPDNVEIPQSPAEPAGDQ